MTMAGLSQDQNRNTRLVQLFWAVMDWLYPPHCCSCKRDGYVFCEECLSKIEILNSTFCKRCGSPVRSGKILCYQCRNDPPPFTQMRSWASYAGPIKDALHSLKYNKNIALGIFLAKPLTEIVKNAGWKIDLVVPMPLSRSHLKLRGYNQSACISRNIARQLNLTHSTTSVKRIKETETQISLNVNERFINLFDAFYAFPAKLINRNILLVDDVITTGATMQNCAIALKNAGASNIYCLSVAKTLLHHTHFS